MAERTGFLEQFEKNAAELADHIALSDWKKQLTYGELDRLSGQVYRYLSGKGIGPEDFVMVNLERGVDIFAACIGVWKAGAAYVICEVGYPAEKVAFIYRDCGCKLRLDSEAMREIGALPPLPGYVDVGEHAAAYAAYTSGTTGNPKGVIHEKGTLVNCRKSFCYEGQPIYRSDDIFALLSPLHFAASTMIMHPVLFAGAELTILPYEVVKNPAALTEYIKDRRVTCSFFTPSLVRLFKGFHPEFRLLFLSSEPASNIYFDSITIYNVHGQTETGSLTTVFKVDQPYPVTPIGTSQIEEVDVFLLNDEGSRCQVGEMGEICLNNDYFRGYINLPEMTENALKGGVYHTGDIGKYLPDGNMVLLGRNDDMVKINGNRVEPAEIEIAVEKLTGLKKVVAKAFKEAERTYVCAYYLKNEAIEAGIFDDGRLRIDMESLRNRLPQYMIPAYFVALEEFPLNQNGKLSRKDLKAPDVSDYKREYVAPESDLERSLTEAMARVLKLEKVGVTEDFFEIGGDSIKAIALVDEMSDIELSSANIYRYRTAGKIAEFYAKEGGTRDYTALLAEAEKKVFPFTPNQLLHLQYVLEDEKRVDMTVNHFALLKPETDTVRFKEAVDRVIRAHPVYMTHMFRNDRGECLQRYDEAYYRETEIIRLTEEAFEAVRQEMPVRFKIFDEPLYVSRIYVTEKGAYFYLGQHHLISDGTSVKIVLEDIFRAYQEEDYEPEEDHYLLFLDKITEAQTDDRLREARSRYEELYRSMAGEDNIPHGLKTDMSSHDKSCGSFVAPSKLKDSGELNLSVLASVLIAEARMNGAPAAMALSVYAGRNGKHEEASVGMLTQLIPVCVRVGEDTRPEDLTEELKEQISLGLSYPEYSFIYDRLGSAVDMVRYIFQKDIFRPTKLFLLEQEEVPIVNKDEGSSGVISVGVISNTGMEDAILGIRYSKDNYKTSTIERFSEQILKNR